MALPRFVVLKSNYNNKYLRYIHEDVQGGLHGYLQFSGEEALSPYTKYQVEAAKSGNGLVHIKCCYNNKYWVRSSQNQHWIVATSDNIEDDQSNWSCTLFKPELVNVDGDGGDSVVRFRHVQLGNYACLWRAAPPHSSCLYAGSAEPDRDRCDVYTFINGQELLRLPRHVAFKYNNDYLGVRNIDGRQCLQFSSRDIGDDTVGHEIFTTPDGSVRIKSNKLGKFWKRSDTWIWADSDDTTNNNVNTLFWPKKIGDSNVIVLRNLGNQNFCKSRTAEGKTDCLHAISSISNDAHLQVEELVDSRRIDRVNFRPEDARIYNQRNIEVATRDYTNSSPNSETVDLQFSYTETKKSTWNNSVSLMSVVQADFQTGIPFIEEQDRSIQISEERNEKYQWGQTRTLKTTRDTTYKATVPPRTLISVRLLATESSFDVPFSYSQSDSLKNGREFTYNNMDDGVYTGIDCFNLHYDTKSRNI